MKQFGAIKKCKKTKNDVIEQTQLVILQEGRFNGKMATVPQEIAISQMCKYGMLSCCEVSKYNKKIY